MKQALTFVALLVLAAVATWYSLSPQHPIALGLDLRGGMRVTFEPDPTKEGGTQVDAATMQRVRDVLENRVNSFGLSGADVRLKGDRQVVVQLPGARNPEEALRTISKVAQLEFRHLNNVETARNAGARYKMTTTPGNAARGESDSYTFTDSATGKTVPQEEVLKDTELILKGNYLRPTSKPQIDPTKGQPMVTFEFNSEGAQRFATFTTENVGEVLAIVLDNEIISAPNINEPITEGRGIISGGFTNMAEARVLSNLLNSGALPIPLRPAETQFVGATLGQESINRSIQAGAVGLGLVLVFMLAYYWLPGFLACIALLFYSVLTFAIFKGAGIFPPIVLDLPGITGFILSVGMAVDANILIFERLKEELRAGKTLHAAVDAGFNRAFSSIFDSNVTTWIVCAILIWLGAPIIKGFAITLAIGVAVSMFTAITVTRTLLHLVMETPAGRNPGLYALNVGWLNIFFPQNRQGAVLRVFEKRKIYFGFSILLTAVSLVFALMTPFGMGLKPGIDFTGGTVIESAFREKGVTRDQVVQALTTVGIQDATVSVGRSEQPWTAVNIEVNADDPTAEAKIRERLATLRGFDSNSFTSTKEGKDLIKASATFTAPVNDQEVRSALRTKVDPDDVELDLKNLKVTTTNQDHSGENAVPVVLIQSQQIRPEELTQVKDELNKIGGGIVEPMYQQSAIGPSVASEITLNAFSSVLVASLAIILYLAFRFAIGGFVNGLKFGVCAVVALIHDVGVVIGVFALMGWLAGWQVDSLFVTACLTVLGFSVHDTIVVYDRIRENLHHRGRGETFADVSDRSITQTFDRSVNTSLTVLLVVAALVFFGGASIRLFNTALLIGIGIGTYSSIFVASPLVVLLERWSQRGAPQPAAARPRQEPAPRPRRETAAAATGTTTTRPRAVEPRPSAGGEETGETRRADTGDPARNRPGSVRPKRKRRL